MNEYILPPWEQDTGPDNPNINPKQLEGLWIPAIYLYAQDLGQTEKILMSYIRMLDQEKHCYASNGYLAEIMGLTEKRIRNMLVDLKSKGYIETIRRNPRLIKCVK